MNTPPTALTDCCAAQSWFQSPEACRFWQGQRRMTAGLLRQGDSQVVYYSQREAGPLGWFSRRSLVQGGPTVASPDELPGLLAQLNAATAGSIYTEIRCQQDYRPCLETFRQAGYRFEPHLNVLITCDNEADMLARMSKSHRRKIRIATALQAQSDDYRIGYATEASQLRAFYRLLRRHYWLKVRKPLPPCAYFEALLQLPSARLLLCTWQGRVIGGMVQIWHQRTVYDLYACALDKAHAAFSPSVMLYYHTMCEMARQGGGVFDTMGAGKPGSAYGVRDFKSRFGGETVAFGRLVRINKPFLYRLGSIFFRTFASK